MGEKKTWKDLEKNMGEFLHYLMAQKDFLKGTQSETTMKEKIGKSNSFKIKTPCLAKDITST